MAQGGSDTMASATSPLAEGIRFYIVRADKSMIPLIPADQLRFELRDVPRKLDHQQLSKEQWQWVGNTSEFPNLMEQHEAGLYPKARGFRAPDYEAKTTALGSLFATPGLRSHRTTSQTGSSLQAPAAPSPIAEESRPQPPLNPPHSAPARFSTVVSPAPTDDHKSYTEAIASIYQRDAQRYGFSPRLPPSGIPPNPSKKEYCTHWIKTGDCAFVSQGCLYKHEMPSLQKLREIGFSTTPAWWKDKTALRGPTWMQRRIQGHEDNGAEKDSAPPERSIEQLIEKLGRDREPKRSIFKKNVAEHPHGILKEEGSDVVPNSVSTPSCSKLIPNLIDFDTLEPPPSRRPSSSSSTSTTPQTSDLSSIPASPSIQNTPPVLHVRPSKTRPVTALPKDMGNEKPSTNRLLRRRSSITISSEDEQLRKKPIKPLVLHASPRKAGLQTSKYAIKDNGMMESAPKTNTDDCKPNPSPGSQIQKPRPGKRNREKRSIPKKDMTI